MAWLDACHEYGNSRPQVIIYMSWVLIGCCAAPRRWLGPWGCAPAAGARENPPTPAGKHTQTGAPGLWLAGKRATNYQNSCRIVFALSNKLHCRSGGVRKTTCLICNCSGCPFPRLETAGGPPGRPHRQPPARQKYGEQKRHSKH